jgi:outer membrane protein OmpA-like peptidoglycan-associated protein
MSLDLLGLVKGYFNNDMLNQASSFLGEDKSTLSKGLDAIIPASLSGIINQAESGNTNSLMNLAKTAYDSGILNNLSNSFTSGGGGVPSIGPSLISGLFGDKFGGIANAVSSFSGLKGSTTSSLFGSVVPVALAALGKYVGDNNATPSAVSSLLSGMKGSVHSAVPSGLNISKLFDPAPVSHTAATHRHTTEHHHTPEPKKNRNLLPVLLAAAAGIILLLWLMKGCGAKKEETVAPVVEDTTVKKEVVTVVKEALKVKLPNGVELDAYKGGIEDLLVAFLNDPAAMPGKDNWFDFNDLNFKFGTAEIVPESRKEVDNIVQILKAFPNAKIKVGGYTDKVGDEAANKKLSGERATAVAAALKDAGVGAQVEGAEGYGSEFAKYPADAPEVDRIKDRRVSVSVRAK